MKGIVTVVDIENNSIIKLKGGSFDPVNNYNYVEDTKVSVLIKKTKCQLGFSLDIFRVSPRYLI